MPTKEVMRLRHSVLIGDLRRQKNVLLSRALFQETDPGRAGEFRTVSGKPGGRGHDGGTRKLSGPAPLGRALGRGGGSG